MNDLLYVIPANSKKEDIIATLKQHPEIKFVSLVGIDLAGNDTDEKIPMRVFLEDIDIENILADKHFVCYTNHFVFAVFIEDNHIVNI